MGQFYTIKFEDQVKQKVWSIGFKFDLISLV